MQIESLCGGFRSRYSGAWFRSVASSSSPFCSGSAVISLLPFKSNGQVACVNDERGSPEDLVSPSCADD